MDSIVRVTVDLDRVLHQRLCRAAEQCGRSTAWIIDHALRRYLDAEEGDCPSPGEQSRPE